MIRHYYGSFADARAAAEALTEQGIPNILHREVRTDLFEDEYTVYEVCALVSLDEVPA